MSLVTTYLIRCDHCGTVETRVGFDASPSSVRETARTLGWTRVSVPDDVPGRGRRSVKDYCPDCAKVD